MRPLGLISESARVMTRYKLRTAFMMLGSLLGVSALMVVGSIGDGAHRKMAATMRQIFGDSSVIVTAGGGALMGGPRPDSSRLDFDDVPALAAAIGSVSAWDAQQALPDAAVRHGDRSATARVLGASERLGAVWNRGVSRGDFFDHTAIASAARVAVIGETVARKLFGDGDPLGADVQIESVPFRVIGVLERFGTDLHGMDRDNEIVVPISTSMRRLVNANTIAVAKLLVDDPARAEATAGEVRRVLRERHGLPAGQPNDFAVLTSSQAQRMMATVERVFFVFVPLLAAISLVAGGVVAATLMLSAVSERVAEIGLRRAVGARPADIARQFVLETAVTTVCGGLAGLALGAVGSAIVGSRMRVGNVFSWRMALAGLALAAIVGLVAGVLPARRAARLQPAETLR